MKAKKSFYFYGIGLFVFILMNIYSCDKIIDPPKPENTPGDTV